MPVGSKCYNIQSRRFLKPTLAKSSGSSATLLNIENSIATIRLPSKKLFILIIYVLLQLDLLLTVIKD